MTDAERIERLEDAVTLLLAERYGDPSTDLSGLRQVVREQQHRLAREVVERMRTRAADTTGMAQYTGENVPAIKEFIGPAATVSEDPSCAAIWLVQNGNSQRIRAGQWLSKDAVTGRVYLRQPPEEYRSTA